MANLNTIAQVANIASGFLGPVGGIASGLLNFFAGKKAQDRSYEIAQMNNEFNERMMERQMAYNTEMQNKQNEYNSAVAQSERLRQAGLNPALALGQVASGSATSSQALGVNAASAGGIPNAPVPRLDIGASFGSLMDMLRYRIEKDSADANNKKILAEADAQVINNQSLAEINLSRLAELRASTTNKQLQNDYDKQRNQWQNTMLGLQYQRELLAQDNMSIQLERDIMQNMDMSLRLQYLPQNLEFEVKQKLATLAKTTAETYNVNANTQHARSQNKLTIQQFKSEAYKTLKEYYSVNGIKISNEMLRKQVDNYESNLNWEHYGSLAKSVLGFASSATVGGLAGAAAGALRGSGRSVPNGVNRSAPPSIGFPYN